MHESLNHVKCWVDETFYLQVGYGNHAKVFHTRADSQFLDHGQWKNPNI
jgi:hypothetical protein